MSYLVLQSSCCGRESWLLYYVVLYVFCVTSPRSVGWLWHFLVILTCFFLYTRGLWKRITIFLHFSCKPYMRLKSYSQVLMCSPELVWISRYFDCTITRRCLWRHMGTYRIKHFSEQLNEAFWLCLCLICGVYGTITPKEFIDLF